VPIYDFRCGSCGERFEALVAADAPAPSCPACGADCSQRLVSQIAPPHKFGLRGGDARRSNAQRSAREEQRREQRKQQREG
jgi:putative FmdB family regulatory protein